MNIFKTNNIWFVALGLSALLATSCEEINSIVGPAFPQEVAAYTVASGEEVTVSFNANAAWQLSSDALWCKVDGLFLDTSGKEGEQNIKFLISADGQSVDESKANITLRMGDESKVIAIITRFGITNAIVLGSDSVNYQHGQTLTIGTSGLHTLIVRETTFDINNLHISKNADWFDISRADTVITLTVKDEYLKYSQHNTTDSICFSDKDTPMLRLNVQYSGMDARSVIMSPSTQWGIKVAMDGQSYMGGEYTATGESAATPINVAVTVLNDAYELVHLDYSKTNGYTLNDTTWYTLNDDKQGNISLSFTENAGADRTAYLFVLPQAISDSIKGNGGDYVSYLIEEGEVKTSTERYLIAELTQEGVLSNSMKVILAVDGYEYLEVQPEADSQWLAAAAEHNVAANNVFTATLELGIPYILNPMLGEEEWNPSTIDGGKLKVYGQSGTEYIHKQDYMGEPTMMEQEGNHYLFQGFQFYIFEPFIVYFVDAEGNYLKALVVEIAEFEE